MKLNLVILFICVNTLAYSQNFFQFDTTQHFGDTNYVVLQGTVKNCKQNYFEYSTSTLFGFFESSVMLDGQGNFFKRIPIENKQQNINLEIPTNSGHSLRFTVKKDDTININWDENNFSASLVINSANHERQKEIDAERKFNSRFPSVLEAIRIKISTDKKMQDSSRARIVNEFYNKEVKLLLENNDAESFEFIFPNLYYPIADLMYMSKLIFQYKLIPDTTFMQDEKYLRQKKFVKSISFMDMYESLFWAYDSYRSFLRDYFSLALVVNPMVRFNIGKGKDISNFTLYNYYIAKGQIGVDAIRDWVIAKNIIEGFDNYRFQDVAIVYNIFQQELGDSDLYLKQLLKDKYTAMITLKKGQPAPNFTLKNEKGDNVSLNDFKGKVVYLDFWGVGCGPCIYEIDNYEKKLHQKYKEKDVAFISICVDSDEKEWKEGMRKHNMNNEGINLIAEGWTDNPVCKEYNVNGIPHYILIDKEGKMVDNNASRMGELLNDNSIQLKNEIDKLLSE